MSPGRAKSSKALDLLAQLVPGETLQHAHALAEQIEREEYVKSYLARRGVFVAVAAIFAMPALFAAIRFLLGELSLLFPPLVPWQNSAVLILGILLWLGGMLVFMYGLLSFLQRAALAERARKKAQGVE